MSTDSNLERSPIESGAGNGIVATFAAGLVALHILLNAGSIRTPFIAQAVFGVLVAVILAGVLAGTLDRRMPRVSMILVAASALMIIQVLQYPVSPEALGSKVLSDLAIMLLPLGLTLIMMQWLRSREHLLRLWLLVIGCAVIAAIFAELRAPITERFEAPSIIAIVGAWVFATVPISSDQLRGRTRRVVRYSSCVAVVLLLPPVLNSGSRTAVIVWILSGAACLMLPGLERMPRLPVLISLTSVAAIIVMVFIDRIAASGLASQILEQTRLEALLTGRVDPSGATRVSEISDVIRTMRIEGGGLDYLLGFGHGATYSPQSSFIGPNVDLETGRIHHIHATPVMLWFRYGLVGLLAFGALIGTVLWRGIVTYKERRDSMSAFLLVAAIMYCVDLMVRNSFVDPGLAFVIAAVFWRAQTREGLG